MLKKVIGKSPKGYIYCMGRSPSNLSVTKFCTWVPFPDVIICARFYVYRPDSFWGEADPRKLAVPIDLKGDLYNS